MKVYINFPNRGSTEITNDIGSSPMYLPRVGEEITFTATGDGEDYTRLVKRIVHDYVDKEVVIYV